MTNSSSTQTDLSLKLSGWAVILGASSGFGEAISLELARRGMDIVGVHLDRRSTMPNVERIVGQIQALGQKALFFNQNAADEQKRKEMCDQMAAQMTSANRDLLTSPRVSALSSLR